jgi:hypothetical protein
MRKERDKRQYQSLLELQGLKSSQSFPRAQGKKAKAFFKVFGKSKLVLKSLGSHREQLTQYATSGKLLMLTNNLI